MVIRLTLGLHKIPSLPSREGIIQQRSELVVCLNFGEKRLHFAVLLLIIAFYKRIAIPIVWPKEVQSRCSGQTVWQLCLPAAVRRDENIVPESFITPPLPDRLFTLIQLMIIIHLAFPQTIQIRTIGLSSSLSALGREDRRSPKAARASLLNGQLQTRVQQPWLMR
jgi:hypothetical protein